MNSANDKKECEDKLLLALEKFTTERRRKWKTESGKRKIRA